LLKSLLIKDLAVVANVTLEFDPGLNVLTGSTGAGKSLILGAVNLLLGHKSPAGTIRAGADEAVVGGVLLTKGRQAFLRKASVRAGVRAGLPAGLPAGPGGSGQATGTEAETSAWASRTLFTE